MLKEEVGCSEGKPCRRVKCRRRPSKGGNATKRVREHAWLHVSVTSLDEGVAIAAEHLLLNDGAQWADQEEH